MSKWQTITADSSTEAEIYATKEYVNFLLELVQIFTFLGIKDIFMPGTNIVLNNNRACVISQRVAQQKDIQISKTNLADIFTKEIWIPNICWT